VVGVLEVFWYLLAKVSPKPASANVDSANSPFPKRELLGSPGGGGGRSTGDRPGLRQRNLSWRLLTDPMQKHIGGGLGELLQEPSAQRTLPNRSLLRSASG